MKSIFRLAAILPRATSAAAQAPQSADMWSLGTIPPGATAGSPAGALGAVIRMLHMPDAVGLTCILGGPAGLSRLEAPCGFALDVDIAR